MTLLSCVPLFAMADPLPSWHEGTVKASITTFVAAVTDKASTEFVPENERIAVFDNDGTLWSERPLYFQLHFVIDRIKAMAPRHPEWKTRQPFKAVLENDAKTLAAQGAKGAMELVSATHSGMDVDTYRQRVRTWLAHAKHPRFNRPYTDLVYQPMMEVITYLQANGFKVFIVSGGGIDFMRSFIPERYGIPSEQIIGSYGNTAFHDGQIIKTPGLGFLDDKETKPVAIYRNIGLRPIAAFGNSDGDLAMLQYTDTQPRRTLKVFVHHTDAQREWAYDRHSHIGKLDLGLDEAVKKG